MKTLNLEPRFTRSAPDELDDGVLYISTEYATVLHLCCCGCGTEVVTPLSPARWKVTYDGETVSLWPSIGNWSTPCRSHYIIRNNDVIECAPWSDRRIAAGRQTDEQALSAHLEEALPPPERLGRVRVLLDRLHRIISRSPRP